MLEPTELVLVPSGISFILGGRIAFAFDRISRIMLWACYQWEPWTITDIKTTKCVASVESVRHFGTFLTLVTNINSLLWDRWYCSFRWRTYPENVSVPWVKTQSRMMSSNGNIFRVTGPIQGESIRGIHRSPVESPHKGQWRGALCFLRFAPEQTVEQTMETQVRRQHADYGVTVIYSVFFYRSLLNTLRGK